MKTFFIAAAGLVLSAPVMAADLGDIYINEATLFDWSGFYAGVNGGYSWGEAQPETVDDFDMDGGFLGVQAGYNYDFGGFVLGAEADIQWSGVEGGLTTPLGTEVSGDIDFFGSVRGRAGVSLDRLMPYVTGGFAFSRATATTSLTGLTDTQTMTGWTAGVGAEYAMTDSISLKAEYLYTDYGTETFFGGTVSEDDIEGAFSLVRIGANVRF